MEFRLPPPLLSLLRKDDNSFFISGFKLNFGIKKFSLKAGVERVGELAFLSTQGEKEPAAIEGISQGAKLSNSHSLRIPRKKTESKELRD